MFSRFHEHKHLSNKMTLSRKQRCILLENTDFIQESVLLKHNILGETDSAARTQKCVSLRNTDFIQDLYCRDKVLVKIDFIAPTRMCIIGKYLLHAGICTAKA